MISGGKVMRLPTETPKTAQAASMVGVYPVSEATVRSAAAWLTSNGARHPSRIEAVDDHMQDPSRPATAMNVMRATANPARTWPIFRLEQRDLMHDEPDLGHGAKREGDRDRPECRLAHQRQARNAVDLRTRFPVEARSSFRPSASDRRSAAGRPRR